MSATKRYLGITERQQAFRIAYCVSSTEAI